MKILIIESDAPFAERLAGALGSRGVEAEVTPDGKDGLDRAQRQRPDAIVLAVELGDKLTGGYAYCNKLKKDDSLRAVPLVLISSQATPETFEQHRKLKTRAEAYLIKPFEPAELIDALSQHVELPPPDIEIDDLADEGLQVEEMETFELPPTGGGGSAAEDDVFGLDAAFGAIAGGDAAAAPEESPGGAEPGMDATGVGEEEFRLDELQGEAPLPAPARVSPGPARAPERPLAAARVNPNHTPGPAAAAAEAALQIAELKGQIAELEVKLETALRDLEELREADGERVQRLEAELARKDAAVKAAQQRADTAQAQMRKVAATADALKGDAGRTAMLEEELARLTQERDTSAARTQELERELEEATRQLRESRVNADTDGDRMRARIAELESEAARNEDRVIKAYQRIKGDEKVKEKTKKALAIALQLLDEHAAEDEELRTS